MFKIKIVSFEGAVGFYRSFNDTTYQMSFAAVAAAQELAQMTGKCYGVFGPDGKIHDTSRYFAGMNLPERD